MNKLMKLGVSLLTVFILIGSSLVSAAADQTQAFKDVDTKFWGYEAIQWGVQQKITSGYVDGTFKPNNTVTEEEFITMLVRTFGGAEVKDKETRWSDPFYRVAQEKNFPLGNDRTATIDRLQVAEIIVGTQGVNLSGNDAVQYMLDKGLTKGKTAPTVEGYKGADTLTRAESIAFIKNVVDRVDNKTLLARPTEPTSNFEDQSDKKISLDAIITAFNQAAKEVGLPEELLLVKETFTPNTSSPSHIIFDYYAKSPVDGRILDSFAFSVFYDKETESFQNVQGSVNGDQAELFMKCMFAAVYQDSEKAEKAFATYKVSEIIKAAHTDKSKADDVKLDDGFYLRYGVLGNNNQILTPKDYFSIHR